jgi:HlyD family secretion protein
MTTETARMTSLILQPLMNLNAKLILALSIGIGLFLMEPMVALAGISLFFVTYLLIFISIKKKLATNSQCISKSSRDRFVKQMEGIGGIRDILLLNRAQTVTKQFEQHSIEKAKVTGQNTSISASPRYFMGFVAIGAVILLEAYLTIKHHQGY